MIIIKVEVLFPESGLEIIDSHIRVDKLSITPADRPKT